MSAMLGRCNTTDMLAKNGWPHDPACMLCSGPLEDAVHLLALCPYTICLAGHTPALQPVVGTWTIINHYLP